MVNNENVQHMEEVLQCLATLDADFEILSVTMDENMVYNCCVRYNPPQQWWKGGHANL